MDSPSGLSGARQPNHEPRLQRFFQFVEDKSQPGICADESKIAVFLPETDLQEYFADDDQLLGILKLIFENHTTLPIRLRSIRSRYTKVFAILLCVDRGDYIPHFEHHDSLSDEKLPFDQPPDHFPSEIAAPSFFKDFQERQWRFCAPRLNFGRSKFWQPARVLPITSKESLGAGGSATTFKIVVHPEYNELDANCNNKKKNNHPDSNTYVIKQYNTRDAEAECKKEDGAFEHLANIHNRVRSGITGNRESAIIGFYGSFEQGDKHNIILEYADKGTLEDYFKRESPPSTAQGIYCYWGALLMLGEALAAIHSQTIDGRVYHGWHQDVKPQNILVSTRKGTLEFKLADLGLSHFQLQGGADAYGRDARGTRTYGAPECYRHESDRTSGFLQVTPKVDVWSFGCVLSEAAIWLVHGWVGLQGYRRLRREALRETDLSDSDCFHNGEDALPCVTDNLSPQNLLENGRRNDTLTGAVLNIIADALVPADYRSEAKQMWHKSQRALKLCKYMLEGPAPATISQSRVHPSSPLHQNSAFRTEAPFGSGNFPRRVLTLPSDHELSGITANQMPSQSFYGLENGGVTKSTPISQIFDGPSLQLMGSPTMDFPIADPIYGDKKNISEAEDQPASPGATPERRIARNKPNKTRTSPGAINSTSAMTQNHGLVMSFSPSTYTERSIHDGGSSQSVDSGTSYSRRKGKERQTPEFPDIQSAAYSTAQGDGSSQSTEKGSPIGLGVSRNLVGATYQQIDPQSSPGVGSRCRPVSSSTNFATNQLTVGNRENGARTPSPSKPPPQIPFLAVPDAKEWRARRKKESKFLNKTFGGLRKPLQHEHYMKELYDRDHVFLLDDASSMQQHWDNVVSLVDILAYIVKRTDEDGVDLHFTICKNLRRDEKKTSDLVDFVEDNRPDPPEIGAERLSNIDYCLGSILHEYQEKLEKDRQRITRRSGKNSWFSSAPKPVRKLNLYVLTDGLWQPEANGIAPLRALVSTLDRLKKPADQVGIQFIQFGNEGEGTKSLSYLDSDLVKLQNFTRDIVDTEPFDGGNIWKMLLGAINRWFDGDNSTASASASTTFNNASTFNPQTPGR